MDFSTSTPLRVDSWTKKKRIFYAVGYAVALAVAIIIGATGPQSFFFQQQTAYNCGAPSNTICANGLNMQSSSSVFTTTVSGLSNLNMFLGLIAHIFNTQLDVAVSQPLTVNLVLLGSPNVNPPQWVNALPSGEIMDQNTFTVTCPMGQQMCNPLAIVLEPTIRYSMYQAQISFNNNTGNSYIGDVAFDWISPEPGLTRLALGFSISYFFITLGVLVAFLMHLRKTGSFATWCLEQKLVVMLLIGVLGADNIFFGIETATSSGFVAFLGALSETIGYFTGMLFLLVLYDKFLKESEVYSAKQFYLPKLIVVSFVCIIELIVRVWFRVAERADPEHGVQDATGLFGLAIFSLVLRIAVFLWIASLFLRCIPVLRAKPDRRARILLVAILSFILFVADIAGGVDRRRAALNTVVVLWLHNSRAWIFASAFSMPDSSWAQNNDAERNSLRSS